MKTPWTRTWNGPLGWLVSLCAVAGAGCQPHVVPDSLPDAHDSTPTAVAAGMAATCVVTRAGALRCWGSNESGQLGNESLANSTVPVDVKGMSSGIAAVAVGSLHSCAVTTAGALKCWGLNSAGELGAGALFENVTVPVDVAGLSSDVRKVAVGDGVTCALTALGTVKCFGLNAGGQLGNGSHENSAVPMDVSGLSSGGIAIAAGYEHVCAVTSAGGVKCWGANEYAQLGDGSTIGSAVPVDVVGLSSGVIAISAGGWTTCALTSVGAVKCWGRNDVGQLGVSFPPDQSAAPVDVTGLASGVTAIAVDVNSSCAISSTGTLQCWGMTFADATCERNPLPCQPPSKVPGLPPVIAVEVGGAYGCAVTEDGTVKCWGWNNVGQLGDGSTTASCTPVDVVFPDE